MANTFKYGIDLGTTNSLIARYMDGKVELLKNPVTWRQTLPSVVAFRRERIIVGDKARELIGRDAHNVFSHFKRKMGTAEQYEVPNLSAHRSPIELSALVLKELKSFIVDGDSADAAVITIPASFDTIQSNATKKAGYAAGFQEVALLQEPIAASLAFANAEEGESLEGKWLVYDLGGGTFDAALVELIDGDMRVVDHEGDNYLGGYDFDQLILEEILLPFLEKKGIFADLRTALLTKGGRLEKLYHELIYKAEEAKIQLSAKEIAEVEFEVEDDAGNFLDCIVPVTRTAFQGIIFEKIQSSIDLLKNLMERNNLQTAEIKQVVLVGGSTYIPFVRERLSETLGIPVNIRIDPTTAVGVGAAFYAGLKTRSREKTANTPHDQSQGLSETPRLSVKTAYQKTSQGDSEYFTAALLGDFQKLNYRITRADGGFDSGLKPAAERISELLPLLPNAFNTFDLRFFDGHQNTVPSNAESIGIMHGKFNLHGQSLPQDICIEVDDIENGSTRLEAVFEKNAILPLRRTLVRTVSRTIEKGSDKNLIINILEGNQGASPASCLPLGLIAIEGREIPFNLVKGSDVEITISISESRDLKVNTYVAMTGQEFDNVFSPSERHVLVEKLRTEITDLLSTANHELQKLESRQLFEIAGRIKKIVDELTDANRRLRTLGDTDLGDAKYQIDEQKRRLAQSLDLALVNQRMEQEKAEYFDTKNECIFFIEKSNNAALKSRFDDLIRDEREVLDSNSKSRIQQKIKALNELSWQVRQRDPQYLAGLFHYCDMLSDNEFKDPQRAARLKELGKEALARQNYDELLSVIGNLFGMLPQQNNGPEMKGFVGLG